MSSIVRRVASKLLKLIERVGDPGAETNRIIVYSKDVAGVTQLFARSSDGVVHQLTPITPGTTDRYSPPELWSQNDVPAAQAAAALSANVSMLFDQVQMIRAGSIIGVNVRFTAALATGSATVQLTINSIPIAMTCVVAAPSQSNRNTQAAGIATFSGGDTIGVHLTTTADFTPAGSNDVEVWLDIAPS